MVATVAKDEPQTEPNAAQPPTVARAKPPLLWPKKLLASLNKSVDRPAALARLPSKIKKGIIE